MSTERIKIPKNPDSGPLPAGFATYRILEACAGASDEEWRDRIKRRLKAALPSFPELTGKTITIARLDPDAPEGARANWYNDLVFFPVEKVPTMDTVFHELTHLAVWEQHQDGRDVPHTSEPYCSILAISRIDSEWIERDDIAYLGEPDVPPEEWPGICQRALDYREERGAGSHYIKQCKEWLRIPPDKEADRTL